MFVQRHTFSKFLYVLNYSVLCFVITFINGYCPAISATLTAEDYKLAVKEYNKHNYKEAATLFDKYLVSQFVDGNLVATPSSSENVSISYAMFYEGVCLERTGDLKHATNLYHTVIRRYKDTPLAAQAEKLLQQIEPKSKTVQAIEPTRDPNLDFFPKETWVSFKRYGNLMLVDGSINGRNIPMLFDTGAAGCLFSTDQLKSLGIPIPTGAPSTAIAGVGTKQQTPAWTIFADIRLGRIERRKFPIQINENPLNYPLIGMNFVEGLEYTIDNQANVIQFKAVPIDKADNEAKSQNPSIQYGEPNKPTNKISITVDSTSRYVYSIPFVEMNRAIIVSAKIADKTCEMILDTGTDICLFTSSQLKGLNIMPRYTGRTLTCKGAAGYMKAPVCIFEQAEFGPIRGPMACLVSPDANLPLPLLGQNFLKGWQITVDHTNHLVKLIRK